MNLKEHSDLQKTCAEAQQTVRDSSWAHALHDFLRYVEDADLETRSSLEFHQRIWDDNPVSAIGMGTVPVKFAIEDPVFRAWVAKQSLAALPESGEPRIAALREFYESIQERLAPGVSRTPRLKIFRVLAAFFPKDFTTVADVTRLRQLHAAMGLPRGVHVVAQHADILRRLDQVIGPPGDGIRGVLERMCVPWMLHTYYVANDERASTETVGDRPGSEKLKPLPAARRRRGMTGVSGGFDSILNILEFAKDGVGRDDLIDHIRTLAPQVKDSTLNTNINTLIAEYDVLRREGELYRLTARGETLLESGDPEDLADWIVTRILGPDHILIWLAQDPSMSRSELLNKIKTVNPRWTSTFGPALLLSNMRQFDFIERDSSNNYSLTNAGQQWAQRIDWTPESLPKKDEEIDPEQDTDEAAQDDAGTVTVVQKPCLAQIISSINQKSHFAETVISRLHNGLWSHARRHFAVLTGLSGSGKTRLASSYARAISGNDAASSRRVRVIAVQPGWYDPSALLGYVNPLRTETYVRTEFLEFVMQAVDDPEHPYTVVLDEMNLSRPEQYLAPILSTMEIPGSSIVLHREGDSLDGVPAAVPYPNNLVVIGTVNMDETTHGLSDKVLDRAFTIEFWKIDLAKYPKWGTWGLEPADETIARSLLEQLMASLEPARLHFGWRTVEDVLGYLVAATGENDQYHVDNELDSVIYAKVLPKLRGDDSPSFRKALDTCAQVLADFGLVQSEQRVVELRRDLLATGSARFWR